MNDNAARRALTLAAHCSHPAWHLLEAAYLDRSESGHVELARFLLRDIAW